MGRGRGRPKKITLREVESYDRKLWVVDVMHSCASDVSPNYFLVPHGFLYNQPISRLKKGNFIRFSDGVIAKVIGVAIQPIKTNATDLLCNLRYGKGIRAMLSEWMREACILGGTRDAISTETCLLVVYEKITNQVL